MSLSEDTTAWSVSTKRSVRITNAKQRYLPRLDKQIGKPDLLVLFTNTVSHKMIRCALDEVGSGTEIVRCHTSSGTALTEILEEKCAVCAG